MINNIIFVILLIAVIVVLCFNLVSLGVCSIENYAACPTKTAKAKIVIQYLIYMVLTLTFIYFATCIMASTLITLSS